MDANPMARLTEQQRACLRFVYVGMTSKEIAPRLGIEPGSVDQHIKAAMRVLGVGDRRTAARLLAEHEQEGFQRLVYHSPEIAAAERCAISGSSTGSGRQQQRRTSGEYFNEEQVPYEAVPYPRTALPLPTWGTKPHHLSQARRLWWILAAAIGIALAFGALVSAIEALVRLTAS